MLYAILSDVHANPVALETALADARVQGAKKVVCLGDVVGYGPDAVRAVELARSACDVVLLGNHDAATAGMISAANFRPEAQAGVRRHAKELSAEALAWLRACPLVLRTRTFVAAHGTLDHPEDFGYILRADQAYRAFEAMGDGNLLFVGHTHVSMWCARERRGMMTADRTDDLTLKDGVQYVVNVGSVGYPRCESESVYVLYDSRRRTVVWRRLPFDFEGYFKQMKDRKIFIAPWLESRAAQSGDKSC